MSTRCYKLYSGAVGSSTSAVAQLVIQRPGVISAIAMASLVTTSSAAGQHKWTLALQSTDQPTTNDTTGELASMAHGVGYSTNGGLGLGANHLIAGLAVPIDQGARIYLHAQVTNTQTANCTVFVYVQER